MNHNQIPGGDPDQRPGDQNNNRNGKGTKNGQTILIFLVISLVVLLLVNFMNGILKDSTEKEITYNQFMKMLENGEVDKVVIQSSEIEITPKNQPFPGMELTYYTGVMADDNLQQKLEAAGVDVMIVGRGGGSIEDLWAFNEEIVARAVYECSVPVISAVGHETDTTIIDFVSDLRAPTPSAAAELAVPDMRVILGQIQGYEESLSHAMEQAVLRNRQRVENYQRIFRHLNPQSRLNDRRQRLMEIEERLRIGMNRKLDAAKSELAIRTQKLEGVSPLRQLERGYAYVSDEEGHGITSAGQVTKGQLLLLDVRDGRIESEVTAVKKRTS